MARKVLLIKPLVDGKLRIFLNIGGHGGGIISQNNGNFFPLKSVSFCHRLYTLEANSELRQTATTKRNKK